MTTGLYDVLENRYVAHGVMRLSIQQAGSFKDIKAIPSGDAAPKGGRKSPGENRAKGAPESEWAPSPVVPGQFYMLKTVQSEPLLARPLSVHEAAGEVLVFLYQITGAGTRALASLVTGDSLRATGPCGNGFPLDEMGGRIALLAGGIGIAPFRYLARRLHQSRKAEKIVLVAGFKGKPFGLDDLEPYVYSSVVATEDGSYGKRGFVTDVFTLRDHDLVVACGPVPMLAAVQARCRQTGIRCLVSVEARMACGFGVCLGCAIRTTTGLRRVCADGPVFPAEEVIFDA